MLTLAIRKYFSPNFDGNFRNYSSGNNLCNDSLSRGQLVVSESQINILCVTDHKNIRSGPRVSNVLG